MFESQASHTPSHVLTLVYVWTQFLDVEGEIPIDHVLTHIEALLVVSSHPCITILLNVEGVSLVPRTDHIFKGVALFEFQLVQ